MNHIPRSSMFKKGRKRGWDKTNKINFFLDNLQIVYFRLSHFPKTKLKNLNYKTVIVNRRSTFVRANFSLFHKLVFFFCQCHISWFILSSVEYVDWMDGQLIYSRSSVFIGPSIAKQNILSNIESQIIVTIDLSFVWRASK